MSLLMNAVCDRLPIYFTHLSPVRNARKLKTPLAKQLRVLPLSVSARMYFPPILIPLLEFTNVC